MTIKLPIDPNHSQLMSLDELRQRIKNDSCITFDCADGVYGGIEILKSDQLDPGEAEEM